MFDRILVLDTETASLKQGVVEIAWYEIDENYNILDKQRALIDPECPIEPSASGVHGIIDEDVIDAPTLAEFMAGRFANETVLLIGHNISFDIRFVKDHFGGVDGLCTLKLSRQAFPDAPEHKLQTLMHYLKLTRAGNHNAMDDVHCAYELLMRIGEVLELDMEEMYELCKKPVRVKKIGFGKCKGMLLKDLPKDYVHWLLTKHESLEENLRWSLENPE